MNTAAIAKGSQNHQFLNPLCDKIPVFCGYVKTQIHLMSSEVGSYRCPGLPSPLAEITLHNNLEFVSQYDVVSWHLTRGCYFFFFFLKAFYFILGYNQVTIIVIVSGRQQRDSAIHIQVSTVPRTPFPSRLSHSTEQGSMGGCFWNTLQKFWDRHRLLLCLRRVYWEWPLSRQLLFWLQRCMEMRSPELGLLLSQRVLACAPSTWMGEKRKSHVAISTNL